VTVTVEEALIVANDDTAGPINGLTGGDAGINVLDNDELNGVAVDPNDVTITSTPTAELTVNADGTVSVTPGTPAGTYTISYTICEDLNPTNCDDAVVTVTVEEALIVANDDTAGPINGLTGGDAGINVLDNDELNGVAVDPNDVTITSTPTAELTVNADGTVSVTPGTPAGTYTISYTICEDLNPTNCDDAVVTVTVEEALIVANDDTAGPINGLTGGDAGINVLDNDELNGVAVDPNDVTITSTPTAELTVNADGTVSVTPGTPAGTYTISYTICEDLNPTNCDDAVVTVTVEEALIVANDDTAGPINGLTGGDAGINVLDNDELNGVAVDPNDVTITSTPTAELTVNADGTVSVTPGTPAGTYTISYTICEDLNPTNCDDAVVTVTVEEALIVANDDTAGPINGLTGGDAGINVLDNDELNGVAVDPNDVTITSTPTAELTVNADGTVSVTPGTPAGTYTITYQICDKLNPENCDDALVTITVINPPVAINDINNTLINKPVSGNVLTNDYDPDGDQIIINTTPVVDPANGAVVIDPDGSYTYTPDPGFTGEDSFVYRICDDGTPSLCAEATVMITVIPVPTRTADDNNPPVAMMMPIRVSSILR
jgi:large repetitive protein